MCNLSRSVMEKGLAEGEAKGMAKGMTSAILASIESLMETMGLSIEQAMAALKIPEAEQQKYMELLGK